MNITPGFSAIFIAIAGKSGCGGSGGISFLPDDGEGTPKLEDPREVGMVATVTSTVTPGAGRGPGIGRHCYAVGPF